MAKKILVPSDRSLILPVDGGSSPGGGAVPGWISYLAERQSDETPNADDDFFDDASVSGDWTELTVTGSQTITEKYGRLSVNLTGSISISDFNALLRAVSPSVGDVVETRVGAMLVSEAEDFIFTGVCFSDGVIAGSNVALFSAFKRTTDTARDAEKWGWFLSTRDGTFTAANSDAAAADDPIMAPHDGIYLRLEYDATNSYKAFVSGDGITWLQVGGAFTSPSFTPTYAGLVWSNWGHAADLTVVTFDYFRYNPV